MNRYFFLEGRILSTSCAAMPEALKKVEAEDESLTGFEGKKFSRHAPEGKVYEFTGSRVREVHIFQASPAGCRVIRRRFLLFLLLKSAGLCGRNLSLRFLPHLN